MASTWDEAAHNAAVGLNGLTHLDPAMHLEGVLRNGELAVTENRDREGDTHLHVAANHAYQIVYVQGGLSATDLSEMCVRKQRDYGSGNILRFGWRGIQVRVSDKLERIKNMTIRHAHWWEQLEGGAAEPLLDAFLDICGYSIVSTMLLDGDFTLPLQAVAPEPVVVTLEGPWDLTACIQAEKAEHAAPPPDIGVLERTDTYNDYHRHITLSSDPLG